MPYTQWSPLTGDNSTIQDDLTALLDLRATLLPHRALREAFFAVLDFPSAARVLEVGSGTGMVTRVLAAWPRVAEAMEVAHATLWRAGSDEGARPLPFADRAFDVVVSHLTLSHLAGAAHVVAEVFRVLRPRGTLAVFDGTYTAVVAQGATTLVDTGRISLELATALIREAHRRVEVGASFGQIVYTSLTAQKPGPGQARRLPQGATRTRRDGTAF